MPAEPVRLDEIEAARRRLRGVLRTPLVPLEDAGFPGELYLKLENLQPIGSFKLRGAGNAIAQAPEEILQRGVYTASAGNMAQGVAWHARRLGVPCTVLVPDHAPEAKLHAIARLGARIIPMPFSEWWDVILTSEHPAVDGLFVHPVTDPAVIAGNGTIGLEIAEDLDGVDAVVVPYGGGGLISGIASALRQVSPTTRVVAAEVETGAPLAAALEAGAPTPVEYTPSFVDGIGSGSVLEAMWPLVSRLVERSVVVSLEEVAEAVRLLANRARVVAEGAGAASVAAARKLAREERVVCVVSGGNIGAAKLAAILRGEL